ncbi:MAG: heme A synthase [Gammaproteobacteria bacterium]|jgi:cytochrome c oxidase assembly protein subunit 15|nr:cytochrome oxidase assembly protein [Gammaproteobacteria bacterium]RZP01567.1 MAG: heme A synthase [Gammaproteobacteria bacterium]|tara:strand:+ start:128 stop:1105 length:978 start_codon:yes stop_codon:yes gene_type:complete
MERIKTLSLLSGILGFVVVALGAWTRLADAGLGCPDWPGCYGFVTIPVSPEEIDIANSKFPDTPYEVAKAIPEVVHRYFAAALGFFIVCIAYLAVRSKDVPTNIRNLSIFLLAWVIMQGTFGYWTVSLKLWPQVVTTHLMSGFLTTALLWLLYFKTKDLLESRARWNFEISTKRLFNISIALVAVQIFLGAWTSTNYASYSCTDFPLCQGQILPEANFKEGFNFFQSIGPNYLGGQLDHESRVAIHLTHRFGAIVVTLFLLFTSFHLYKRNFQTLAYGLIAFLTLQVLLGISNVIFALPLLIAVGHNLGGLLLITYLGVLRLREH